jgi:two-component system response regulator HydG
MVVDFSAISGGTISPICIVDDDPSMLKALERALEAAELPAQLFQMPSDFLCYAKANRVNLAIIDVWLPGINGLDLQRELRKISPQTRVIIITANSEDSVRSAALERGASAFFVKPFEDEAFLRAVELALG